MQLKTLLLLRIRESKCWRRVEGAPQFPRGRMIKIKDAKGCCGCCCSRNCGCCGALWTSCFLTVGLCARSSRTWLHHWRVKRHRLRCCMSKRCLWAKMARHTLIAHMAASRFRVVSDCLAVALISQGNGRWTLTLAGSNSSCCRASILMKVGRQNAVGACRACHVCCCLQGNRQEGVRQDTLQSMCLELCCISSGRCPAASVQRRASTVVVGRRPA